MDATCDRIAIIKDGKIVSEFIANDLKHKQDKIYRIKFSDEKDKNKLIASDAENPHYKVIKTDENSVMIAVNDKDINYFISDMSEYRITDFTHMKETLEDYFMSYYKEDKNFGGAL